MKRKDSKDCYCRPFRHADDCRKRTCHWGNCTEWVCPDCGCIALGIGWVFCPCDYRGCSVRYLLYPDMATKKHPAVKENKAMRKQKHRKVRK